MARKPDHFDLAMEAAGHELMWLERRHVVTRLLLYMALDRVAELEQKVKDGQRWRYIEAPDFRRLKEEADRAEALDGEA